MAEIQPHVQKFLLGVTGAVEATSFEHQSLWMDFAEGAKGFGTESRHNRFRWIENTSGIGATVGNHGGEPVAVSLRIEQVNLQRILFYHATSNVVNYEMIEEWLRQHLPDTAKEGSRYNMVDAMNFHNVFPSYEKIVLYYRG